MFQAKANNPGVETRVFLSLSIRPSVDRVSLVPSLSRTASETQKRTVFDIPLLIVLKRPWRIRTAPSFLRSHLESQDFTLIDLTYG